jgi:5-methyltetrahydropteroyltriglutamate--homocysteine methyltransferase
MMPSAAKSNPPFRAEHIGSLLRPPELVNAFKMRARDDLSNAAYRSVEEKCIVGAIRLQEELGLQAITDGEFRRRSWAYGFVDAVEGFVNRPSPFPFRDAEGTIYPIETCYAAKKIQRTRGIATGEFAFVRENTERMPKVTLPSPSFMHFFQGARCADPTVYPDPEQFWNDLLEIYEAEVAELGRVGAQYIQLDEVPQAMLCDAAIRQQTRNFGEDPERLAAKYIAAINRIVKARPTGMTVGMHLCRGNFRSRWLAAGGYDPIAERLFNDTEVDGFFLEYDSSRAGDFAPLRFVPSDKFVVLGMISTKTPVLKEKAAVCARIDEAARYVPLDRLAISPQCGFASTAAGNLLSIADQRAKLELVVDVAREVWGNP